jgi:hypothetical protein
MVANDTTVAQLVKMGISLEAIQTFVDKKLKASKRQEAKEQREAEKSKVALKVLEVLNADPAKKWKTGHLVTEIFGIKKSADSVQEDERYRVHGLISSSLKDMTNEGTINKVQVGGNACHTWYQSTLPIPEAEFSVVVPNTLEEVLDPTVDLDFQEELDLQDEEDFQEALSALMKEI